MKLKQRVVIRNSLICIGIFIVIYHEKQEFLKSFWNEIRDDFKRKKIVEMYATKFNIHPQAAAIQVNKFLFDESQRICKENKPRIEVREDGAIVHVYQSKINYAWPYYPSFWHSNSRS